MNICSEISSANESNPFHYLACNDTEEVNELVKVSKMIVTIITLVFGPPINSYVIWLIIRGAGNGLAAEFFILNFCVCEMLYCTQFPLSLLSYKSEFVIAAVQFLDGFPITGRPLFQCLICVERYLAVIYPVTFLKYKPLRYRLMCCTVVWVACLCSCIFSFMTMVFSLIQLYLISYFVQFVVFLSLQLFCCVAVLRALKQSGPGERGREREEENNMKKRAFHLILITTVTTFIMYAPQITLMLYGLFLTENLNVPQTVSYVFFLFAGLVQPVFFLYRVEKLKFIKCQ